MKIQDKNGTGIALNGIDPVSKFSNNPQKGKVHLTFSMGKERYYFATLENLEKFKKNPENYLRRPNELSTREMISNYKERNQDEKKSRWEKITENIGKGGFSSGREMKDVPVQHDGMSMKNQKKNKRNN